ncbi:Uma2 family endonuclease [Streptomyces sp. NPDC101118]|uniref:Uma2 family endonuclease n=1 Tax=Streptomyces sp. NPDC101118 TaxID=3366109 RepID=UPI00381F00E5
MTDADTAQMPVEDFEELAHTAPETVQIEFINGKLEVRPPTDGTHGEIVMWLVRLCFELRPELGLYQTLGLVTERSCTGRYRPAGVLAPVGHFRGSGEWAAPDGVLMAVEVSPHRPARDRRDFREKRDGYAAAGIPVYLLIDRDAQELVVYAEPARGKYAQRRSHPYGARVRLPAPVAITLDTEKLKDYTR